LKSPTLEKTRSGAIGKSTCKKKNAETYVVVMTDFGLKNIVLDPLSFVRLWRDSLWHQALHGRSWGKALIDVRKVWETEREWIHDRRSGGTRTGNPT
jgi:hypothetical protein